MSARILHRISAGLLFFFAAAHTFGMLDRTSKGVAVDLVEVAMHNAAFPVMGVQRTLWDFYFGFGILVTVLLVLAGFVSLELARLASAAPGSALRLGLAHISCLALVTALCLVFFFPAPTICAGLATACTAAATVQTFRGTQPEA